MQKRLAIAVGERSAPGKAAVEVTAAAEPAARSRSGGVYEWLRNAILSGEIRPNEPLIEADLAATLNVSRTPIREALQRLAVEQLIVPRKRGWSVREITAVEAGENSEVRAALEGYAARLAAERASDQEIAEIAAIHRHRLSIDPADNKARVETNRQFHGVIVGAARNERLRDAILRSGRFYFNGSVAQRTSDEEFHLSNRDHDRIVAALLARDGDASELAMRNHILRTFHIFQRLSYPSHESASLAPLHVPQPKS
ncbi:GntR family transcriptional regulator [Bosea sp. (in: a-proteobacteria)]|uniref:GntR family transcriptional regulator n=1 Tax=Bosea sp. (in: a-proteobacteria) TaxID=1871050 RepID=UPI002FC7891A